MARGRKRKNGKRTKSGRLSRAGQTRLVKGSERAQAMQALYGQDGCDAIGRAYRTGLLGQGSDAKAMMDTARKIAKAYWAAYEVGGYFNPLADRESGSTCPVEPEIARRREEWLSACLATVNRLGRTERRFFDALVIDVHPDSGPAWLDRYCYAVRTRAVMIKDTDASALDMALTALAMLADVEKPTVQKLKAA